MTVGTRAGFRTRRMVWFTFGLYVIATILSQFQGATTNAASSGPHVNVTATDRAGHDRGKVELAFLEWNHDAPGVPVLLLHGSPGSSADFKELGPLMASSRRVISPDLLGYGGTRGQFEDRSIDAYARTMLAMMDRLGIQRAHVLGWSNGGGVALHMADLAPDRVVSLTMLASIGLQEHEPSGSYFFEHFKYKAAKAIVGILPDLLPHFGTLGTYDQRTAWASFFDDSDQRPLRGVMKRIGERGTPTLILHGRRDFLVPAFAAEDHYHLIESSRLVMLDASHFIPFLQAQEASTILTDWFATTQSWASEQSGQRRPASFPWRAVDDRSTPLPATWVNRESDTVQGLVRMTPWWIQILMGVIAVALWPMFGTVLGVLLVVRCTMDPFILLSGMLLGFAAHLISRIWMGFARSTPGKVTRPRVLDRPFYEGWSSQFAAGERSRVAVGVGISLRGGTLASTSLLSFTLGRTLAIVLWCVVAMVVANIVEATWMGPMRRWFGGGGAGVLGLLVTLATIYLAVLIATSAISRAGRQYLRVSLERIVHHEYWPTWVFYLPIYPYFLFHAFRNGGVRQVTCCNPEIEHGGGWAGESKHAIMLKLRDAGAMVLPTYLLPSMPEPGQRVAMLESLMTHHPQIATLPIVLKPNEAQRGHGFKVLRSMEQAPAYFASMTAAAVVQPYHEGPQECGVFWMRYSAPQQVAGFGPDARPIVPGRVGFIYSITRKEFPSVVGDGMRTLEQVVRTHPRYRRQSAIFLERLADERSRIPAPGEIVRLAIAGNHAQGTLFRDGADLITPQLEAEVDRIAAVFPRLDYGRFDVRFTSEADLKAGRGLAIIELNGASAEPTNMYDPDRSYFWAMGVLARMWRQVIELAKERRAQGVRPLTVPQFVGVIRMNAKSPKGNPVAD